MPLPEQKRGCGGQRQQYQRAQHRPVKAAAQQKAQQQCQNAAHNAPGARHGRGAAQKHAQQQRQKAGGHGIDAAVVPVDAPADGRHELQRQQHRRHIDDPEGGAVRPEVDAYHALDQVARRQAQQRQREPVAQKIEPDVEDEGGDAEQGRGDKISLPGGIGIHALVPDGLCDLRQRASAHPGVRCGQDEVEIVIRRIVVTCDHDQRNERNKKDGSHDPRKRAPRKAQGTQPRKNLRHRRPSFKVNPAPPDYTTDRKRAKPPLTFSPDPAML